LERRDNPSTFNWTGLGGDNVWSDPGNWDQNAVPTTNADVTIANATADVIVDMPATVNSVSDFSNFNLNVQNALTVNSSMSVGGLMGGAQLIVSGSVTANTGAMLNVTALDLSGQIHLAAGSQLWLSGNATLHGGPTIDGDGVVTMTMGSMSIADSATVNNLNLSATVQGPGVLTITGTMNMQNGALARDNSGEPGTLDIASGATLNINYGSYWSAANTIDGWTINDYGAINWTQGDVGNKDSTVNVAAGGTFNISSSGTWKDSAGDGLSNMSVAGTLELSNGGLLGAEAPVTVDAAFNLTGNTNVDTGSLVLNDGGTYSGTFTAAANADVTLADGVFTAQQGGQGMGQGNFIVGRGGQAVLNIPAGRTVSHNNFILRDGGVVSGLGVLEINGNSSWTGGRMVDSGRTANAGNLTVKSTNVQLTARLLLNTGTLTWSADFAGAAGSLTWQNTGQITNACTWNVVTASGTTLVIDGQPAGQGPVGGVANQGPMNVTGFGSVIIRNMPANGATPTFTNSGTITIQNPAFTFTTNGRFLSTGRFVAALGSSVYFLNGGYEFKGVSAGPQDRELDGDGTYIVGSGARVIVPYAVIGPIEDANVDYNFIRASNFQMQPGSMLTGGGDFSAQNFAWNGGIISSPQALIRQGTTLVESGDVLTIGADVTVERRQMWVANGGTLIWGPTAGVITMQTSSTLTVAAGGTFQIYQANGTIDGPDNTCNIVLQGGVMQQQFGQFSVQGITFGVPVTNRGGQVSMQAPASFNQGYAQSGAAAVLNLLGTNYSFSQLQTSGGSVNLGGGRLLVSTSLPLGEFQQGSVFNLRGALTGWLLQDCSNCTINLPGNLDVLGGNNQTQVGLFSTQLSLGGFTMNIAQGGISSDATSQISLQGGTLNFQGQNPVGPVTGPGSLNGQVIIAPGAMLDCSGLGQIGTTDIGGDFTMQIGSSLGVQIGGDGNDCLAVAGNATLAGTLSVTLVGYTPNLGDSFTIITCASYQRTFENSTVDIGGGYCMEVCYSDPTSIRLVVALEA
jgi:hypothetical protein